MLEHKNMYIKFLVQHAFKIKVTLQLFQKMMGLKSVISPPIRMGRG